METKYNSIEQSLSLVERYFYLIRNLSARDKLLLIAKISESLIDNQDEEPGESREEILRETYGSFISDKTADELIDEIRQSRHFRTRNPQL